MSTAELRAHEVYDRYNLGALPNDVKDQIIILMLSNRNNKYMQPEELPHEGKVAEECPPQLSISQLHERINTSREQISKGLTSPIDEFFDEMDTKYPWLCR